MTRSIRFTPSRKLESRLRDKRRRRNRAATMVSPRLSTSTISSTSSKVARKRAERGRPVPQAAVEHRPRARLLRRRLLLLKLRLKLRRHLLQSRRPVRSAIPREHSVKKMDLRSTSMTSPRRRLATQRRLMLQRSKHRPLVGRLIRRLADGFAAVRSRQHAPNARAARLQ